MVAPRRFALIGHTHLLTDFADYPEAVEDAIGAILVDSTSINFTYDDATPSITAVVLPAGVDHNALANLTVGDPHTQYQLEANLTEDVQDIVGAFLVDSTTIDFTYSDGGNSITTAVIPGGVDHNALLNFVANKHIDHTAVTLTAGAGLTGGGDISASRTFDIGAGTGITVNANDIQIAAAYLGDNPTASVGLAAVNGSATSYMRSDAAPALSQAIIPTWTETHTWTDNDKVVVGTGLDGSFYHDGTDTFLTNATGRLRIQGVAAQYHLDGTTIGLNAPHEFNGPLVSVAVTPGYYQYETDAGVNEKIWRYFANAGTWTLTTRTDANAAGNDALTISRTGTALVNFNFGNVTNNPNYNFLGTGHVDFPSDNCELRLGAGPDLRLTHDGTNSLIRNDTGELRFNMSGTTVGARLTQDGRFYGTAFHNNAGAVTGATNQYVASGTYTPGLTNVTNVAGSTARQAQWLRVGNVVTVSGQVDVDPTAAGATELGVALPIASALTTAFQLGGTANSNVAAGEEAMIDADATNDRARIRWTAVDVTNHTYAYTFTYEVL